MLCKRKNTELKKKKVKIKNILSDDFGLFMWGWAPY